MFKPGNKVKLIDLTGLLGSHSYPANLHILNGIYTVRNSKKETLRLTTCNFNWAISRFIKVPKYINQPKSLKEIYENT